MPLPCVAFLRVNVACVLRRAAVFFPLSPEAAFKEKSGAWDPMLKLIISSPHLIVGFEVRLSTTTTKAKGWVAFLLVEHVYIGLLIMEKPMGKGRVRGRGREGVGANFRIDILRSKGNPKLELTS
jgi:hypothetical protein